MVVLRFYQGRGGEITPAAGQATAGIPEPEYLLQYRILAGFRNVQFLTDVPSRLYCRFAFFFINFDSGQSRWYHFVVQKAQSPGFRLEAEIGLYSGVGSHAQSSGSRTYYMDLTWCSHLSVQFLD